jgi:hypothetical protein
VTDAEQLEGLPLQGSGGGDEPEAAHGGVGGCDGVQADGAQVGEQSGEAAHGQGRWGLLGGGLGQRAGEQAAGTTGLDRATCEPPYGIEP